MDLFFLINWPITLSSLLLLSISTLVIFSSSKELATQQLIFALIGLVFYFFISRFDYRAIKSLISPLYITVTVFLVLVFILGVESRGAIRWIPLGLFNVQPSEFAKPVLILVLARFWSNNLPTWRNIFKSLLWVAFPLLLIFKQPDLGTFLTIMAIWSGMLFAAQISFKKVLLLALLVLSIVPVGWFTLHDYQKQRIFSFISPQSDPLGIGYNIIQSTIAVGSGQVFGKGLGQGTQSRLQFLPEYRTDFIFASISEELGLFGSLLIIGLYFYMVIYGLITAQRSRDYFGFLIAFGVVSMLIFQVIVNVGMNVGLLPITGITLPLVSYGGSSVVATLISLGLVASVVKFKRRIDIGEVSS